jgi:hypothetical protein
MKDTKPKPRASKLPLREPAKPLEQPESKPPAADHPIFSLIGPAVEASAEPTPPTPRTPRTPPTPPTDATHPISPERDFTKVPNSLARDVVPAGHFTGKSKQLYDCLYLRTRGAVVPVRSVAISKPELMRASGIGSERTLLKNLGHLKEVGLVRVSYTDGKHEGNTYEVLTPEEAGLRTPRTPPTPPTPGTARHARAEVPPVPPAESGVRGVGSEPLESTTSGEPKTSFKTNTERDDDEAFAGLISRLRQAALEITGREPTEVEAERWEQLADLLVTELKIAAGRTQVSSAPAFLTEHLRRRLWKKDRRQVEEEGKAIGGRPSGAAKIDASRCPDCFGTSMWYPEGFDKGVARCRHEKLMPEEPRRNE